MQNEWYLVGALIAAPFAIFLVAELIGLHRRRRARALAQRSKQRPPRATRPTRQRRRSA